MTYTEKLKDPRWQKKRLLILQRDSFSCRYCDDCKKTLHVHHLKYYKDPWDVDDSDLLSLCEDCHSLVEFLKKYKYWQVEFISKIIKTKVRDEVHFAVILLAFDSYIFVKIGYKIKESNSVDEELLINIVSTINKLKYAKQNT